jgi:ABC-2 type transport system permease protein
MPSWLRAAANLNPVTHLAAAGRGLRIATATAGQIEWVLAAAAAWRPAPASAWNRP